MPSLRCVNCSHIFQSDELDAVCSRCGSAVLLVEVHLKHRSRERIDDLRPGVWRYADFLPRLPSEDVISLGEGGTPLLRAERLAQELGLGSLLIKDESRNPTGSFIDRGSTVLVSLAKSRGVKECSCVTTGNLGASLAAYCAKAAISARVRIQPSTDRGKLYQMLAYGAEIEATSRRPEAQSSVGRSLSVSAGNPYVLEGEKTTCYEIVHDLGWKPPDVIVVPVGTGGHLSMIWRAIQELRECGFIDGSECRLLGVQFAGSRPRAARPNTAGASRLLGSFTELEESQPFFRKEAASAIRRSNGMGLLTTASETVKATGLLARTEGIFAEPASASVVASLETAVARGFIRRSDVVVCVITSAGLKDTKAITKLVKSTKRVSVREDLPLARMQIGETKLALMRSLFERPSYGYELWHALSVGRRITTASVYQHLYELEEFGLVSRSGTVMTKGRERILYGLTKKGSDFLRVAGRLERTERSLAR